MKKKPSCPVQSLTMWTVQYSSLPVHCSIWISQRWCRRILTGSPASIPLSRLVSREAKRSVLNWGRSATFFDFHDSKILLERYVSSMFGATSVGDFCCVTSLLGDVLEHLQKNRPLPSVEFVQRSGWVLKALMYCGLPRVDIFSFRYPPNYFTRKPENFGSQFRFAEGQVKV